MDTVTIEQEVQLPGTPHETYEALMDEAKHAEFTCYPAKIDRKVGGRMTAGGDYIEGEFIELVPDALIIQTWHASDFPKGHYSQLEIMLEGNDEGTLLRMRHSGVPESMADEIGEGWHRHYWEPLRTYQGQH